MHITFVKSEVRDYVQKYICYLMFHNRFQKNLQLRNHIYLLAHSFWGSGTQTQLPWSIASRPFIRLQWMLCSGQGYVLMWGSPASRFVGLLFQFSSLWFVGLRTATSYGSSAAGHPQSATCWDGVAFSSRPVGFPGMESLFAQTRKPIRQQK